MEDLFEREQAILDRAMEKLADIRRGVSCDPVDFEFLVQEYNFVLRQLRRITRLSDRTTLDLNTRKLGLQDKVYYDAITGIYNRQFLEEKFVATFPEQHRRAGDCLSVLMLDVDFFKQYNDTYGHTTGDEALKTLAEAIKQNVTRSGDFVARYGGEEFVVVLPHTGKEGAIMIAERILDAVRARKIPHLSSRIAPHVTVSIGVASGELSGRSSADDFIKRADDALYVSKREGRNRATYLDFKDGANVS